MKKIGLLFLMMLSLSSLAFGKLNRTTLDVSGSGGRILGFIQIPKGGQFGSTDERKPTLSQLNIKDVYYANLSLKMDYDAFSLYASHSMTKLEGHAKLNEDLKTHGDFVKKGSNMTLKTPLSYSSLGIMHDFKVNDKLTISPLVELMVMRISYTWSADGNIIDSEKNNENVTHVDDTRGYFNTCIPVMGTQVSYQFTDKTSLEGLFKFIIPVSQDFRKYFYGSVKVNHTLYQGELLKRIDGYIGVEGRFSETRDTQDEMQNFVHLKEGPLLTLGTKFVF